MEKKHAISVATYQSILYLIIGMFLGLIPWHEHIYILIIILLILMIGAHYIAKCSIKETENAMQYNDKEER